MSREAVPRRPLPPRRRNQLTVPQIAVGIAVFSPVSELYCCQIGRRRPSSGHADLTGGLLVSSRFRWSSPRPPSCLAVVAGEPAGSLPAVPRRPGQPAG
jgi:hypothetical protein